MRELPRASTRRNGRPESGGVTSRSNYDFGFRASSMKCFVDSVAVSEFKSVSVALPATKYHSSEFTQTIGKLIPETSSLVSASTGISIPLDFRFFHLQLTNNPQWLALLKLRPPRLPYRLQPSPKLPAQCQRASRGRSQLLHCLQGQRRELLRDSSLIPPSLQRLNCSLRVEIRLLGALSSK